MVPYNKTSGCVSDLTRSLTMDPILSPSFTDAWSDSTATLESLGSTTFIVGRTSNDTMFEYSIDQAYFVINGITISSGTGGLIYSATYSWGFFNDTIPYLEDLRINANSQFMNGGVDFYNIFVNGVSGIAGRNKARCLPSENVTIRRIGRSLQFDLPMGSTDASLYDIAGKAIYDFTVTPAPDQRGFLWDGRNRTGQTVAAGRYSIVWNNGGRNYARLFSFGR